MYAFFMHHAKIAAGFRKQLYIYEFSTDYIVHTFICRAIGKGIERRTILKEIV